MLVEKNDVFCKSCCFQCLCLCGQGKEEVVVDDVDLSSAVSDSQSDRLTELHRRRCETRFCYSYHSMSHI